MHCLIHGTHGVAFNVVQRRTQTLALYSIDFTTRASTPIAHGLPFGLQTCLDAIGDFNARMPSSMPPAPADLLVRHVAAYKNNVYGFHMAAGPAQHFASAYATDFMIELCAAFSKLDDAQHADIERELETLHPDDWEFGLRYRRWRGLREDR